MSKSLGLIFLVAAGLGAWYFAKKTGGGGGDPNLNVKVYWTDHSWSVITWAAFNAFPNPEYIHHYEETTLALGDHGTW